MKYTGRGTICCIGVNLSLNAYSTYVLPPLIPPYKGGKKKSSSLPFIRGGLGWGNADRDSQRVNSISRLDKGFMCKLTPIEHIVPLRLSVPHLSLRAIAMTFYKRSTEHDIMP